jgi:hypothetical protein
MVIDRTDTSYLGSVRTLLGVDRDDSTTLSDEDINDMTVIDSAEMDVLSYLPSTVDPTSPKVRLAVIYTMAALLCPTMPARVDIEVKGIDTGWKRKAVDYSELAEKLLGQANTVIENLREEEGLGDSDLFRVAPSKRAVNSRYEIR